MSYISCLWAPAHEAGSALGVSLLVVSLQSHTLCAVATFCAMPIAASASAVPPEPRLLAARSCVTLSYANAMLCTMPAAASAGTVLTEPPLLAARSRVTSSSVTLEEKM
jgi:hypothetical protein